MRRILKEVQEASDMFAITQINNYMYKIEMLGPKDSLYEDVNITLYYKYKQDHPFSYPTILFRPSLFHPNIDEEGFLRIPALQRSPAETLLTDLLNVTLLLYEPHICEIVQTDKGKEEVKEGYEEQAVNNYALCLYRTDREQYKKFVYSSLLP